MVRGAISCKKKRKESNHEVGVIGFPSLPGSHQQSTTLPPQGRRHQVKERDGHRGGRERYLLTCFCFPQTRLLLHTTPCISTPALITRTAIKSKQLAASDCTPAAGKAIFICMTWSYSLSQPPLPHSAPRNLAWMHVCWYIAADGGIKSGGGGGRVWWVLTSCWMWNMQMWGSL